MRGNFSLHGAKTIRSSTIHSGLSNPHLTVLEHNYTLDDTPSRVKQTVFHSGFPFEVRENLFLGESCKEPHLKIKVLCYQHLRKSSRITDEWNGHWEFSEIGGKYSAVGRGGHYHWQESTSDKRPHQMLQSRSHQQRLKSSSFQMFLVSHAWKIWNQANDHPP